MDWLAPIERFIYYFSWPRLLRLLFVLGVLVLMVVGYEKYTNHFKLARIEKTVEILKSIQELDSKGGTQDPALIKTRNELVAQLSEPTAPLPTVPSWSPRPTWKLRFLCVFLPWLLLAIRVAVKYAQSPSSRGRVDDLRPRFARHVWAGILIGITLGVMLAFVPPIWWPWFNLFILPWLPVCAAFLMVTLGDALE